ncbi:LysR family transcriptional regulator [Glaciibacter flavus]|uniref:LysR family transcriptional regulator n=1 Tax=Orlajensenia flava TaxID=2565934 RepID=A0A4V3WSS1_9MICO|nr:LysR family transcriptional regulator [Glaciibacter flavus]
MHDATRPIRDSYNRGETLVEASRLTGADANANRDAGGVDLRELEAVVAVQEHGSFSAAAAALFISQPALTRRVALLERELHARLFLRSSRGVTLTDAGHGVMEPARRALAEAESIREVLRRIHGGASGSLRLISTNALSIRELGPLIAEFHMSAPEVDLRVSNADTSAEAFAALEAGAADLAIVDTISASEAIASTVVREEEQLAVFAVGDGARGVDPDVIPIVSAGLLEGRAMIHLPDSRYPRQPVRRLFDMVGVEPTSTIEAPHWELMVAIARAGGGVAVVPRAMALRSVDESMRVAQPPTPITTTISLAGLRDHSSPVARRFARMAAARVATFEAHAH